MHRLTKYTVIINSNVISTIFNAKLAPVKIRNIVLSAGLYKPSTITSEHGLLLSTISGVLSVSRFQLHGKREKRTVSLSCLLSGTSL